MRGALLKGVELGSWRYGHGVHYGCYKTGTRIGREFVKCFQKNLVKEGCAIHVPSHRVRGFCLESIRPNGGA